MHHAPLRWPIFCHDPRWLDLASRLTPDSVAWYPSSGYDFRAVMELSDRRRTFHGLPLAPSLIIHTDIWIDSGRFVAGGVLHRSARTTVTCTERIDLAADLCTHINPSDASLKSDRPVAAALLRVQADSIDIGRCESWVLFLPMSNLQFALGWVGRHRVRFGTLIRVRMGLALGGCAMCLSPIYPWLRWMGVRQLLADGEAHDDPEREGRMPRRLLDAGFPAHPPRFHVTQSGSEFVWSGYTVRPLRLQPEEGNFDGPDEARRVICDIASGRRRDHLIAEASGDDA